MRYYFFKTVRDGSRNRLNPLPFQTAPDGTAIIQKLNTQVAAGDMRLREAYPIGTVFCSSMCELSARAGTPFYCAGDIYPILEGNSGYDFNLPTPTRETLGAGRMVADGWSVLEAMERCYLPFYEGTKTEGERIVVYKTFLRH